MSKSYQALIKQELLIWARVTAQMSIEEVAKKLHVKVDKIHAWESGELLPTVKQLRKLAHVYNQTFAAFYLPYPPKSDIPTLHDYRRHAGTTLVRLSPELALDIRTAWERRGILLDLYEEQGESPTVFADTTELDSDSEQTALKIRNLLGISYEKQKEWRDPRIAFNNLREAVESLGVLVFQSTGVSVSEVRGYSLSQSPLPVIVVNRKDSYAARSFTMLHELMHIMSHVGGLCDLLANGGLPPEESKAEVLCNRVAGGVLIPRDSLLNEPAVVAHLKNPSLEWVEEEIELLSKTYSASREAVVRRLLVLGLTTTQFYEVKRKQYQEELKHMPRRKGFVPPSVDLVSASGKFYVRTILDAFFSDRITSSDVSDYLGIRLKHLDQIVSVVGTEFANI